MGLLQEIKNVLKSDVLPPEASEVAKLDKAFVEYAKNTATAYATAFNAIERIKMSKKR